jgi:hypothetical protein
MKYKICDGAKLKHDNESNDKKNQNAIIPLHHFCRFRRYDRSKWLFQTKHSAHSILPVVVAQKGREIYKTIVAQSQYIT